MAVVVPEHEEAYRGYHLAMLDDRVRLRCPNGREYGMPRWCGSQYVTVADARKVVDRMIESGRIPRLDEPTGEQ